MQYQNSWEWIHNNWHQPLPAVAYVALLSCAVSTKNVMSLHKHDVFVEISAVPDWMAQEVAVCLPRVCILRRNTSELDEMMNHVRQHVWG
jgi:hypothetical protein